MAQLIADVFISADGYAQGRRSPAYFGLGGPELDRWVEEQAGIERRLLFGRRTYELFDGFPAEARDESWHYLTSTPSVVFSRTLDGVGWPGATLHAGEAVDEVRRLKEDGPDLLTVGSLSLVRSLLAAGVVDRLRLAVFPLIIGATGGEWLFADLPDVGLELADQQVLDGRVVLLDYHPAGLPPYAD